jgi:acetyl esterase
MSTPCRQPASSPPLDRLDRELAVLLADAIPVLDLEDQVRARELSAERAARRNADRRHETEVEVTDCVVSRATAPDVRLRSYRPTGRRLPLPGVIHFHGGAFIVGDLETEDRDCRETSFQAGCTVLSVDYRLAPENPFPAAVEDGYDVLRWVEANAEALDIDPTRLAVSGASAGGCIAACVAMMARDQGGPSLCMQQLIYPVLDDRLRTTSAQWTGTPMLTSAQLEVMWRAYLGDWPGTDDVSPYAAPARQTDLTGLPATYMVLAGLDPLRDEALDFASRLIDAGVAVELHHYPDAVHGFDKVGDSALGGRSIHDRNEALAAALEQPSSRLPRVECANG